MQTTAHDVIDCWFGQTSVTQWFVASTEFDAQIRERFAVPMREAAEGRLEQWTAKPMGWLALLILLDQFPRNVYRRDPRAFATDPSAQCIALSGLARGDDGQLPAIQRVFAYLPLEHAEDRALQQRSVALFEALSAEVPAGAQASFDGFLDYARRHREVIERFGRFPHRNAVLERPSTADEIEYLAQSGAGF